MAKILLWDIETSPIIAAVWGLYDQNIPYHHVIQDWHIICAAWKWIDEDEIKSIRCTGTNDKAVVKKLAALINSADAIVAHNGNNFDWKKFMARVVHHGLPAVNKPVMIDTLMQARKFGFTSRKLDDLGESLDLGRKRPTEKGLWVKAAQGCPKSIKALEDYCRGDIPPLENLYHKLRPYVDTSLNMGHFHNNPVCPKCGHDRVQARGLRHNKTTVAKRYQCWGCFGWFTDGKSVRRVKNR